MARPSPVPPQPRVIELPARLNVSDRRATTFLGANSAIGHLEPHELRAVVLGTPRFAPGGIGRHHRHRDCTCFGELDGVADEVQPDLGQARSLRCLSRRLGMLHRLRQLCRVLDDFLPEGGVEGRQAVLGFRSRDRSIRYRRLPAQPIGPKRSA
jgi:hypothetical protein